MTSRSTYTREDDAAIIADYKAGVAVEVTAKRLGRSESAVNNRIQRLRAAGYAIPARRPDPRPASKASAAQKAEVTRLRAEGLTVPQIAARLGRKENWVAGRIAMARDAAKLLAEERAARKAKWPQRRTCNLCPTVFQPETPYQRFCTVCRAGAVHEAGWSLGQ